jgi:hypothetical protein
MLSLEMAFVDVLMAAPFHLPRHDAEPMARFWTAHLRPLDDAHAANLALLLVAGEARIDDRWFTLWDARFSQWQRSGINGTRIETLFMRLFRSYRSGARIRQIFDAVAQPTGSVLPSEVVFAWLEALSPTLTGPELDTLFTRLLTGIGLSKAQCRRFVGPLLERVSALTGTQLDAVSAAILAAKNVYVAITAEDCTVLAEQLARSNVTNGNASAFFTAANAPLSVNQAVYIATEVGFSYGYTLVTTGAAVIHTAITACNNSFPNLIRVLQEAKEPTVPHNAQASPGMTPAEALGFLPKLTGMAAATAHTKMVAFIAAAAIAMRDNLVNQRSWTAIATLVQRFIDQGRRNPPALAGFGAAHVLNVNSQAGVAAVQATHERICYFIRAHTLANCDFTIGDRTRDDISFWDAKTVGQMQTEVDAIENSGDMTTLVDQANNSNVMTLRLVDDYDVGIVWNAPLQFSILHFHPLPTHHGMIAVRSALVRAIGNLF